MSISDQQVITLVPGLDDDAYVVPLSSEETAPNIPVDCRSPNLCSSCADAVRAEAISWLQGLSDDHFGFNAMTMFMAGHQASDLELVRHYPFGMSPEAVQPKRR